ncbi:hypothetical protein Ctob_000970 [Chrysochromulina tobinii]|uniref:Uncharacterized protein n=1 Tax=Chrysochromulina tobinii TaxID=1460289 RepID=A0A0M0J962_9EUKA|nr:hypothetical protein Ctob_000970 [Chrysochromulina tobinii]|eukprot:KOO23000.1 hypothetical protein Ctob_000970 [Chrysochromulina sp. CCMP291]
MAGSSSESEPSWAERLGSLARVGSSLLSATGKAASNIISIKTKEDLAARPDQQALALDRHHRNLREDAKVLEAAMVRKRSELEECSIRCEEIRDALARREAFLADPGPRHALKARREAAAALYATLAAEQDAAEAARQRTSAPRHEWFDEDDDALDAQPQQREEDDATTSAAEGGGSSSGGTALPPSKPPLKVSELVSQRSELVSGAATATGVTSKQLASSLGPLAPTSSATVNAATVNAATVNAASGRAPRSFSIPASQPMADAAQTGGEPPTADTAPAIAPNTAPAIAPPPPVAVPESLPPSKNAPRREQQQ